ncbi:MAG TPA: alpha/beta fold hydrolase [Terracidiphilus sp.]|jgi:homoserine O-acetyltransferase|nr:alpha/beta fold hydrolase [Terracidiphilus sp.]
MNLRTRTPRWIVSLLLSFATLAAVSQQPDGAQQFANLGRCTLESGVVLEPCRIGYRTFGHLNAARGNAVLMPTWLFGASADLVGFFGDGSSSMHLVDTAHFFGIAIDSLANGVSSSPSNTPAPQHGPDFPAFTIRDMVNTQHRVVTEILGIRHLHAVIGLSMGGEQTFVWAAAYPGFFDLAVPILGTPRLTVFDLQTKQIQLDAVFADPAFHDGHYTVEPPLKLANLFGALTVTSPQYRNANTPRAQFAEFLQSAEAPQSIDANDRVAQLRAIIRHDVIGSRTIAEAAHAATAHFLVIVNANDHLVNPQPALDWAAAIGAPTYISHGDCAHIIMSCDAAAVSARVRSFLATGALQ